MLDCMAISIRFDGGSRPLDVDAEQPLAPPDYSLIARDSELQGEGPFVNWPGPPLIMPAGLLPDGTPMTSDECDNATRICGVAVRRGVEADAVVRAYQRQQRYLRRQAGLTTARLTAEGYVDTPETAAAILALHREEIARRAAQGA